MSTTETRSRPRKQKASPASEAAPTIIGGDYDRNEAQRVVLIKDGKWMLPAQVSPLREGTG